MMVQIQISWLLQNYTGSTLFAKAYLGSAGPELKEKQKQKKTYYFEYTVLVVQSVVSLTSSLRVISLTVLADSIYNILIFFAEKM